MPIRVEHGPIGMAATIAARTGASRRARANAQLALQSRQMAQNASIADRRMALAERAAEQGEARQGQIQEATEAQNQLNMQAIARDEQQVAFQQQEALKRSDLAARAFDLQKAGKMRTPLSSMVGDQLKKMRSSGQITQKQYEQGLLAAQTKNTSLMTKTMVPPAAVKPGSQLIDTVRQPFADQQKALWSQAEMIEKSLNDPMAKAVSQNWEEQKAGMEQQKQQIQQALKLSYEQERYAVQNIDMRQSGTQAALTGQAPVSAETRDVAALARERNPGAQFSTGGQNFQGQLGSMPMPAPQAADGREEGKAYRLPNGQVGVWRGTGWEVQ